MRAVRGRSALPYQVGCLALLSLCGVLLIERRNQDWVTATIKWSSDRRVSVAWDVTEGVGTGGPRSREDGTSPTWGPLANCSSQVRHHGPWCAA